MLDVLAWSIMCHLIKPLWCKNVTSHAASVILDQQSSTVSEAERAIHEARNENSSLCAEDARHADAL